MAAVITTIDNEWDPVKNFDEWYERDRDLARQYGIADTCSILASLTNTSDRLSDELNEKIREDAIDDMVKYDPLQRFKKIVI